MTMIKSEHHENELSVLEGQTELVKVVNATIHASRQAQFNETCVDSGEEMPAIGVPQMSLYCKQVEAVIHSVKTYGLFNFGVKNIQAWRLSTFKIMRRQIFLSIYNRKFSNVMFLFSSA